MPKTAKNGCFSLVYSYNNASTTYPMLEQWNMSSFDRLNNLGSISVGRRGQKKIKMATSAIFNHFEPLFFPGMAPKLLSVAKLDIF